MAERLQGQEEVTKMRITNKIMQRNNLSNINTNKIYQDKLATQMSTEKKVNRPSDDPVVAIRALRLRSSVTEITQYYSRNIKDAASWLTVTEEALKNLASVITSMKTEATKGSNGDLEAKDRQVILEQLKALGDEIYSTGDADYAGRYVFGGYRTDTSLSFPENTKRHYTITEQLDNSAIDQVTHIVTHKTGTDGTESDLLNWNNSNKMDSGMKDFTDVDIDAVSCHRIRLAYDDCAEDGSPSISFKQKQTDAAGKVTYQDVTWSAADGDIQTVHAYEDPYSMAAADPKAVIYVPETGELLLGSDRFAELAAAKDDAATAGLDEGEIRVTYEKNEWKDGDLRPEHYFYCESTDYDQDGRLQESTKLTYNADYLNGNIERQAIEYDVGFNQTIRINSTADQCFQHGVGREVDDLVAAMQEVLDIETVRTNIGNALEAATDPDEKATLQKQLDAVTKAWTLSKDKCQKLFEGAITEFQGYLDQANLAITNNGTLSKKLELIENRMQNQKTTFETLKSENEDIDITEVAIGLNSAELTYNAALMASGKVMQNSLLNFI